MNSGAWFFNNHVYGLWSNGFFHFWKFGNDLCAAKKKWHYFFWAKLSKLVKPIFGSSFNYKLEYELWTIRISSIYSKATIALQYLQTIMTQLTLKWPFIIIQPGIFNMFAIPSLQSHHCIAIFANNNYRIYIEMPLECASSWSKKRNTK